MGVFAIYNDKDTDSTVVSNLFIDEYMKDANEAQLKVYLYLVRRMNAGQSTSISEMADLFNHTEKEIARSLRYWEKKGLIAIDVDTNGTLLGVHLCDPLRAASRVQEHHVVSMFPRFEGGQTQQDTQPEKPAQAAAVQAFEAAQAAALLSSTAAAPAKSGTADIPSSPEAVSPAGKAPAAGKEKQELFFIVEQYIGKPLSVKEMQTLCYICDELHFSSDLVDYLIQYCVELGKKDFRYIEKVAMNWAESGITTTRQAQKEVSRGRRTSPGQRSHAKKANSFNNFEQHDYDFAGIEAQILKDQR